jgi:hypothetical protein
MILANNPLPLQVFGRAISGGPPRIVQRRGIFSRPLLYSPPTELDVVRHTIGDQQLQEVGRKVCRGQARNTGEHSKLLASAPKLFIEANRVSAVVGVHRAWHPSVDGRCRVALRHSGTISGCRPEALVGLGWLAWRLDLSGNMSNIR